MVNEAPNEKGKDVHIDFDQISIGLIEAIRALPAQAQFVGYIVYE